ncbi:MAG: MarR family transcriptional regulator [Acetobacteraceae bacterium]|nr:MarR family transcriptional regulator [Acetobacteraceae bacterium]
MLISSKTNHVGHSPLPQLHRTMLTLVRRKGCDLTARQLAVFLSVYLSDGPHTVRALARELEVCKSTITRALDRLGEFGLARRKVDPTDRRSVFVLPTPAGWAFLAELPGAATPGGARTAASAADIAGWRWAEAGRPANDTAPLHDGAAFDAAVPHGRFRAGPALRPVTEAPAPAPAGGTAGHRPASNPAGPCRRRGNA